jgi:hypothetical protein
MAMIGWEDRDAAGREALMDHVNSSGAVSRIRNHWSEILLWTVGVIFVVRDWAPIGRTIISWF